jgi:hypothetical protein
LPHLALPLAACSTVILLAQEAKTAIVNTATKESTIVLMVTSLLVKKASVNLGRGYAREINFFRSCNNYTKRLKNKKMQKPTKIFAFKYYNLSSFI